MTLGAELVGVEVGSYRILRYVAESGDRGSIYRARDTALERDVALTVLSREGLHAEVLDAVTAQWQSARTLSHPVLPQLLEVGEAGPLMYAAREWMDGVDLGAVARELEGPQLIREVLSLGVTLADVLGVIHEGRSADGGPLVHGRLHPRRVFLLDAGYHKLLGAPGTPAQVARLLAPATEPIGLAYRSPEQVRGELPDARSDVYGVALLIVRFLGGRQPLVREDLEATRAAVLAGVDLDAIGLPSELAPVLRPCLAVDRADRPATMDHLLRGLRPLLDRVGGPMLAMDWKALRQRSHGATPAPVGRIGEELAPPGAPGPSRELGRLARLGLATFALAFALVAFGLFQTRFLMSAYTHGGL